LELQFVSGKAPDFCLAHARDIPRDILRKKAKTTMTDIVERGRITARVPLAVEERLREAADLVGATLNQFLVQAALEKANEVIDRERFIAVTPRDADFLLNLLDDPSPANAKLMRARERYHRARHERVLRSTPEQKKPSD